KGCSSTRAMAIVSRLLCSAAFLAGVLAPHRALADTCGYPSSPVDPSFPRTGVVFNESTVLKAFAPTSSVIIKEDDLPTLVIKLWYSDEHPLTLGATSISGGPSPCGFSPIPSGATPHCESNPSIGCADATDPAGR